MKTGRYGTLVAILLCLTIALTGCIQSEHYEEEEQLKDELTDLGLEDPELALARIDSAEQAGVLSPVIANITRGFVYWNSDRFQMAAFYSEQAMADPKVKNRLVDYCAAIMILADFAELRGENGKAIELANEMISLIEDNKQRLVDDTIGTSPMFGIIMKARALTLKADCEQDLGHDDQAERLYLESIDVMTKGVKCPRDYGDIDPLFYSLLEATEFYLQNGTPEKALALIPKGDTALARLTRCKRVPDYIRQYRRNNMIISHAMVYAANGQLDKAEQLFHEHQQAEGLTYYDIAAEARYMTMINRDNEALSLYRKADSIFTASGEPLVIDYVNKHLMCEYNILMKIGRTDEALAMSERIRQLTDSVRVEERRTDVEQTAEIHRQQEEISNRHQSLIIHRIILAAALLVCLLIAYFLWRSYKYNRVLKAKNRKLYQEIEQRRQEQQEEMEQLQAAPEEQLTAEQQLYRRLCKLMDEQKPYTDENLNREMLAQLLGTNTKYIGQAIRECSKGETVSDFINRYRLEHVARLLKTTDDPIAIIGELSGIPSRATLARLFRNAYGMTPTEYRKI